MPTQTITYEPGLAGKKSSFSWTVTNVIESGTFVDGTPWVVVSTGAELIDLSPKSETRVSSPTSAGNFNGFNFTINGSAKNPVARKYINSNFNFGSVSQDALNYLEIQDTTAPFGLLRSGSGKLPFDGRVIRGTPSGTQQDFDNLFDFDGNIGVDIGAGIIPVSLSAGDVIVTAESQWNDTTEGTLLPNLRGSRRSPVDRYGVLTVLSSAPTEPCFRPPLQWIPGRESERPSPIPVSSINMDRLIPIEHESNVGPWDGEYLLDSPTIHDGDPIGYSSTLPQYGLSALSIEETTDLTYGVNFAKRVLTRQFLHATNTLLTEEQRNISLYRILQYGIDAYGASVALIAGQAGAGQRAAELKPWAILAGWILQRPNMFELYDGIRSQYSGTSVVLLTDRQLGKMLFHDDHVPMEIRGGAYGSSALPYGHFLIRQWASGTDFSILSAETELNPTIMTLPLPDSSELKQTGVGKVFISSYDMSTNSGDVHNKKKANFYNCYLRITDGPGASDYEYRIIDTGSVSVNGAIDKQVCCYFLVNRPWQNGTPDSTSTMIIYPFRNGEGGSTNTKDVGRWCYDREGGTIRFNAQIKSSISPLNDTYGTLSYSALLPVYSALKKLHDATNQRAFVKGNTWKWLAEVVGGDGISPENDQANSSVPTVDIISNLFWDDPLHAQISPVEMTIVKQWLGYNGTPSGYAYKDFARLADRLTSITPAYVVPTIVSGSPVSVDGQITFRSSEPPAPPVDPNPGILPWACCSDTPEIEGYNPLFWWMPCTYPRDNSDPSLRGISFSPNVTWRRLRRTLNTQVPCDEEWQFVNSSCPEFILAPGEGDEGCSEGKVYRGIGTGRGYSRWWYQSEDGKWWYLEDWTLSEYPRVIAPVWIPYVPGFGVPQNQDRYAHPNRANDTPPCSPIMLDIDSWYYSNPEEDYPDGFGLYDYFDCRRWWINGTVPCGFIRPPADYCNGSSGGIELDSTTPTEASIPTSTSPVSE